jgi:hypothetical protein
VRRAAASLDLPAQQRPHAGPGGDFVTLGMQHIKIHGGFHRKWPTCSMWPVILTLYTDYDTEALRSRSCLESEMTPSSVSSAHWQTRSEAIAQAEANSTYNLKAGDIASTGLSVSALDEMTMTTTATINYPTKVDLQRAGKNFWSHRTVRFRARQTQKWFGSSFSVTSNTIH